MFFSKLRQTFSPSQRFNRDAIWNLGSLAVMAAAGISLNFLVALGWTTKDALGVFNQVYAIYVVLSQLAVGGVHASVLKQVSYQQDDMRAASLSATSGLMLGAMLAGGVCLLGLPVSFGIGVLLESPDVAVGLRDVLPGLFFFSLNKILLNVLNGARHMRSFAVFSALRFVFILGGVGGVYLLQWHYRHLAVAFSVAEILLFISLAIYVRLCVLNSVSRRIGDRGFEVISISA
ncbi:MAG: hypothetical protein IPK83_24190 [Planctomycetes bacterium]|nr:hypothetical protein [Planctomycetota bacterium]